MKTQKQALKWAKSKIGTGVDWDGFYGFQCMDLTVAYMNYVTDGKVTMWGNAIDAPRNSFGDTAKVIRNYPAFVPKAGDIVVWTSGNFSTYGHIAIVLDGNPGGDLMTITVAEQNWLGLGASKSELTTKRVHNYSGITHFIRPNFKAEPKTTTKKPVAKKPAPKKATAKKPATKKVKKRKIMLVAGHGYNDPGAVGNGENERDFIRKNITKRVKSYLEKAGHEVALYGGSKQDQDMFQDTAYGQSIGNRKDYGLYWVKNQGYEVVVEFHLDAASPSASGGHTIIASGVKADSIDTGIQNAIKKHVGTIRGITGRANLLNCNVSKEVNINYRLVELGFITNKSDMNKIKKNLDAYCKDIAEAISGGAIKGGVSKSTASKPTAKKAPKKPASKVSNVGNKFNFNGLYTNKYGTRWYYENNSFTCNVRAGIVTRVGSPFTTAPKAGILYYGQTVTYNQVAVNNKEPYVWISWITYDGTEVWMPIEVLDKNGVITDQWGTFAK